jgi:hypothetical protein
MSAPLATSADPRTVAQTYFAAWQAGDFDRLRSILDEGVTFRGPLGKADNAEDCLAGLKAMAESITEIRVLKIFIDEPDVLTWFDLYTKDAAPIATANWMHVEDGKIARIRVTFDPRAIAG